MKFLVTYLFSIVTFLIQDISSIRELYANSSKGKPQAEKFITAGQKLSKDNKTFQAYRGAALSLKSKYTTNKQDRKDFFVEGVTLIENAIKAEPNNVEIRFIRLSIQENTPKFLKYKANINEDKKVIITGFDKQNKELKDYIKLYVKTSKVFTEAEKQKLK